MNRLVLIMFVFVSCNTNNNEGGFYNKDKEPFLYVDEEDWKKGVQIEDINKWWGYHKKEVDLFDDFQAYDVDSVMIFKEDFLDLIKSDSLIPFKVGFHETGPKDTLDVYRLRKVYGSASKSVLKTIRNEVDLALHFYKMETSPFPKFSLTTIEGKTYTNESLKGKYIIFKTWFINCLACIKEFPELNEFVIENKDENVVFISLALDDKKSLDKFLENTEFEYETVAEQEDFITKELALNAYPTHIFVNQDGFIIRAFQNSKEMIDFVESIGGFAEYGELPPPPPVAY